MMKSLTKKNKKKQQQQKQQQKSRCHSRGDVAIVITLPDVDQRVWRRVGLVVKISPRRNRNRDTGKNQVTQLATGEGTKQEGQPRMHGCRLCQPDIYISRRGWPVEHVT